MICGVVATSNTGCGVCTGDTGCGVCTGDTGCGVCTECRVVCD